MRSNPGPAKFQSKLYSKRLLIDLFNPNLAVQSIVAMILIQNPDYLDQLQSNFSILIEFNQNWSKMTVLKSFSI